VLLQILNQTVKHRLIQNDDAVQWIQGGVLNCQERFSISNPRRTLSYQKACHPERALVFEGRVKDLSKQRMLSMTKAINKSYPSTLRYF